MRATAYAKVNFGLHVGRVRAGGLHDVTGVFQSIGWTDDLVIESAEEDGIFGPGGRQAIDGMSNLAWRAVDLVRSEAGSTDRVALQLTKRIPVAAGLGGGSADAAAALALAGRRFGVGPEAQAALAPALGSDVPFCHLGGSAIVSGTGEGLRSVPPISGFALALVVPPVEVSTAAVFRAWDALGASQGPSFDPGGLPPQLRDYAPLRNDLHPAAVSLAPEIEEWRDELSTTWGRPVALSGSGPTLFSYFVDLDEAADAIRSAPVGARAAEAAELSPVGWSIADD